MATKEKKYEEAVEALGLDEDMSAEEEFDIMEGFLKAAEMVETATKKIEIKRNGKLLLRFRVRAVTGPDMRRAQKAATSYIPNPKMKKLKVESDRDPVIYESYLIYIATVEEDKKKYWDNQKLKEKFDVMQGYELIDKVLLPGEKDAVLDQINILSGYNIDDGEEEEKPRDNTEIAKNS